MLQFVCDVVKDTGKEEYVRLFVRIGLDCLQLSAVYRQTLGLALSA